VGGEHRTSLAVVESTVVDHQSVIYRNGAADFVMTKEDIDKIDMQQYDGLVFTGTLLASPTSRAATEYALVKSKQAGLITIFDVDYRAYSWESEQQAGEIYQSFCQLSDIIVGNDDEFAIIAGDKQAGLAYAKVFGQSPNRLCIYKMGAQGAISFHAEEAITTGIYEVTALKPVGAGDAFMGGFLHALTTGTDLKTAVERGSACAAIVVSNVGCASAMPNQTTLNNFLTQYNATNSLA